MISPKDLTIFMAYTAILVSVHQDGWPVHILTPSDLRDLLRVFNIKIHSIFDCQTCLPISFATHYYKGHDITMKCFFAMSS